MKVFWRIRRLANAASWSLIFFAAGACAGVMLIAMLPGMPWTVTMGDATSLSVGDALDLAAQRSMASAAWWMVAVTTISSTVGAVGLFLIFATLREARRSANAAESTVETARDIGMAQVRAYLSIEAASMRLYVDDLSGCYIELRLKNSGQSPARHISFLGVVRLKDWGRPRLEPLLTLKEDGFWPDIGSGGSATLGIMIITDEDDVTAKAAAASQWLAYEVEIEVNFEDVFGEKCQEFFTLQRPNKPDDDVSKLLELTVAARSIT